MNELPATEDEQVDSQDFTEPSIRKRSDPVVFILNKILQQPAQPVPPEQRMRLKWLFAIIFVILLGPLWVVFHYVFYDNISLFVKSMGVSMISSSSTWATCMAVEIGFVAVMKLEARVLVGDALLRALSLFATIASVCNFLSNCLPDKEYYIKSANSS